MAAEYLTAIRTSYDTVADAYASRVKAPAQLDPLSRGALAAFAEMVRSSDRGPVADLGCGPGRVTAHLAALGAPALGIDISARMIDEARRTYPGLPFAVGSMASLCLGDGCVGGILVWYSVHHTPAEHLPSVFAELFRVLAPGGHLLIGGWSGDGDQACPTEGYGGRPVSYTSYFRPAGMVVRLLEDAGFDVTATLVQNPGEETKRQTSCVFARRPEKAAADR